MYIIPEILEKHAYPNYIRQHPIFSQIQKYIKVFDYKGLQNQYEPINNSLAVPSAKALLKELSEEYNSKKEYLIIKYESGDSLTSGICNLLIKLIDPDYIVLKNEGKISFRLPEDIYSFSGEKIFPVNKSLFAALEKLNECKEPILIRSPIEEFSNFSQINFPIKGAKIHFSSDPWDLATMSMRGISTCQSWNGEYRQALIGSMLDPFIGVIYISSGGKNTPYGSRMLYRSVVRFVVGKDKKQFLLLDTLYRTFNKEVVSLFKDFLSKKSNLNVIYAPDNSDWDIYTPATKLSSLFRLYNEEELFSPPESIDRSASIDPYQNFPILRSNEVQNDFEAKTKNIRREFNNKLLNWNAVNSKDFGYNKTDKINQINGLYFRKQFIVKSINSVIKKIEELSNFEGVISLEDYRRKFIMSYFNLRKRAISSISGQVSEWNKHLRSSKIEAFSKEDFAQIMITILTDSDRLIKDELKRLFCPTPLTDAKSVATINKRSDTESL